MTNVSQEQLNDEQINKIADIVNDLFNGNVLTDKDHSQIEDLIVSHLAVNAELKRYKAALKRIVDIVGDPYSKIGAIAIKALEGGSSNV